MSERFGLGVMCSIITGVAIVVVPLKIGMYYDIHSNTEKTKEYCGAIGKRQINAELQKFTGRYKNNPQVYLINETFVDEKINPKKTTTIKYIDTLNNGSLDKIIVDEQVEGYYGSEKIYLPTNTGFSDAQTRYTHLRDTIPQINKQIEDDKIKYLFEQNGGK
jgi:hypothetical protein